MADDQQRIESIYSNLWSNCSGELFDRLDQSLNPRSSELLYDIAIELGINANFKVLDAGSGLGIYS